MNPLAPTRVAEVEAGDVASFPADPHGNRSQARARVLIGADTRDG